MESFTTLTRAQEAERAAAEHALLTLATTLGLDGPTPDWEAVGIAERGPLVRALVPLLERGSAAWRYFAPENDFDAWLSDWARTAAVAR